MWKIIALIRIKVKKNDLIDAQREIHKLGKIKVKRGAKRPEVLVFNIYCDAIQ